MVRLGVYSKELTSSIILDQETVDHIEYTYEFLSIALGYESTIFGEYSILRQHGAKPHIRHLAEQRCPDDLPLFIDKGHWLLISPN